MKLKIGNETIEVHDAPAAHPYKPLPENFVLSGETASQFYFTMPSGTSSSFLQVAYNGNWEMGVEVHRVGGGWDNATNNKYNPKTSGGFYVPWGYSYILLMNYKKGPWQPSEPSFRSIGRKVVATNNPNSFMWAWWSEEHGKPRPDANSLDSDFDVCYVQFR